MEKYKYVAEFEINASPRMIYPYLSTASGLEAWFADYVAIDKDKTLDITWDDEKYVAKIISKRTNAHVRYQFIDEEEENERNQSYLDFKIDFNEMTQTSFIKIVDYSDMNDEDDLNDMWGQLVGKLKETLGA